jgi:hypothetical protein
MYTHEAQETFVTNLSNGGAWFLFRHCGWIHGVMKKPADLQKKGLKEPIRVVFASSSLLDQLRTCCYTNRIEIPNFLAS